MKRILFNFEGAKELFESTKDRDNANKPYRELQNYLISEKYDLYYSEDGGCYDFIVYKDLPACDRKINNGEKILILSESPIVRPENFKESNHKNFDKVLTWNRKLSGLKYYYYNIPVCDDISKIKINFKDKHFLCDVSSNKFSNYEAELYSERRKFIKICEKILTSKFDLYGYDWSNGPIKKIKTLIRFKKYDRHVYKSYKGIVDDKIEVMSKYKFVICFENTSFNDYISNRVFDILRSGSIPIYKGAENIDIYIPNDCLINVNQFENYLDLINYLENMNEEHYNKYIKNITLYLQSDQYKHFGAKFFINNFMALLND